MDSKARTVMYFDWIEKEGFHPAYATKNLMSLVERARRHERSRCLAIIERFMEANREGDNTVALLDYLQRTIVFEY